MSNYIVKNNSEFRVYLRSIINTQVQKYTKRYGAPYAVVLQNKEVTLLLNNELVEEILVDTNLVECITIEIVDNINATIKFDKDEFSFGILSNTNANKSGMDTKDKIQKFKIIDKKSTIIKIKKNTKLLKAELKNVFDLDTSDKDSKVNK